MSKIHNFLSFFIIILSFQFTRAQETIYNTPLTHIMSAEERHLMQNYARAFVETAPPTGSVRGIAEWEPMEAVIIAYTGTFGIPVSMISEMSEDVKVIVIVANSSEETTVRNTFQSNSVVMSHVAFLYQDPNTYWTRDYGPWFIAVNDEETAIIDFPYNRPRPNDDNVPVIMAPYLNIDLYGMNITHTGGNFMCDGYAAAASTDLVWEENTSQSQTDIRTKMQNYMGITDYQVTIDPLDDYIKHVDCWGKYLDVDKILITQVPSSDYRYADYEAVANYFATHNCSWGYPYEVYRAQAATYSEQADNPYTNSLILNNKVFVPQTGHNLDDDAIAVYQQAMPGYEIIGVYSTGWLNSDALHCRTHEIADRQMLYIQHYPLHGVYTDVSYFTIDAKVTSYGGSPLIAGFPKLVYQQNNGTWNEISMSLASGTMNYTAQIPAFDGTNTVKYYIIAQNDNSKTSKHPTMGSVDPHVFTYTNTLWNEEFSESLISVFPNPSSGEFRVVLPFDNGSLEIMSLNGQIVRSEEIRSFDPELDLTEMGSGMYILRIINENKVYTKKLMLR
jgi:agmatine/peptidylarginine deiminase